MSIIKDFILIFLFIIFAIKYIQLYKTLLEERNYFINILSHDLRVTMIAQLRGLNLIKKNFNEDLVQEISESCKFSIDLINLLINTYKYKNKEQVLFYEKVNLTELINSVVKELSYEAKDKNIGFQHKIKNAYILTADKNELYKALFILISTAITNANKNSSIEIKVAKKLKNLHTIISYNGNKLTNNEYKTIFFKNPRFSAIGYGIKMHLCKKIIDFHNGKIKFENFKENINEFSFLLPLRNLNENSGISALTSYKV